MVQGYTARLRKLLTEHGCVFMREGKGDHELWRCPDSPRPVTLDGKVMSRRLANAVLKQAGIKAKL